MERRDIRVNRKKIDTHFSPLPSVGGQWRAEIERGEDGEQGRRFLLFKLISFLDGAQLSIFCFLLCVCIAILRWRQSGWPGNSRVAVSFLGFFLNAPTFMHCFSLSFFDLCNCFYYFHIVHKLRGGRADCWNQKSFSAHPSVGFRPPFFFFLLYVMLCQNSYSMAEKFTAVRRWESAGGKAMQKGGKWASLVGGAWCMACKISYEFWNLIFAVCCGIWNDYGEQRRLTIGKLDYALCWSTRILLASNAKVFGQHTQTHTHTPVSATWIMQSWDPTPTPCPKYWTSASPTEIAPSVFRVKLWEVVSYKM